MTPRTSRRSLLRTVVGGGVLGSAGCLSTFGIVLDPDVEMRHARFRPRTIAVSPGDTVTWHNTEELRHTVTAYEDRIPDEAVFFDSGGSDSEAEARQDTRGPNNDLNAGNSYRHTFGVPGFYHYFCVPHEDFDTMAGTVVVESEDGDRPPAPSVADPGTDHVVDMGQWTFSPEAITIDAGESVGWTNGTGIAHSVTGESVPDGADYFASGGFDSAEAAEEDWYGPRDGDVLPESPYTHTFDVPGEYEYYCILHRTNMVGTVTVREG